MITIIIMIIQRTKLIKYGFEANEHSLYVLVFFHIEKFALFSKQIKLFSFHLGRTFIYDCKSVSHLLNVLESVYL